MATPRSINEGENLDRARREGREGDCRRRPVDPGTHSTQGSGEGVADQDSRKQRTGQAELDEFDNLHVDLDGPLNYVLTDQPRLNFQYKVRRETETGERSIRRARAVEPVAQRSAPAAGTEEREGTYRGRGPKGFIRSDERIFDDVIVALTDDDFLDATNLEVRVQDGEVLLSGAVETPGDRWRAQDLIEAVRGVKHVRNDVRIQTTAQLR